MQPPSVPYVHPAARLQWFPVEPSWIVSGGLLLLTVLPHQIPKQMFRFLASRAGSILFAALSVFVFWKKPVLGMAMFLLLLGVRTSRYVELFGSLKVNKDIIGRKHKWFQEEVMMEDPHIIQEKTDGPGLVLDEVTEGTRWFGEDTLGEMPKGIQDRPTESSVPATSTQYNQVLGK
jgi:hypothetical protein